MSEPTTHTANQRRQDLGANTRNVRPRIVLTSGTSLATQPDVSMVGPPPGTIEPIIQQGFPVFQPQPPLNEMMAMFEQLLDKKLNPLKEQLDDLSSRTDYIESFVPDGGETNDDGESMSGDDEEEEAEEKARTNAKTELRGKGQRNSAATASGILKKARVGKQGKGGA